MSYVITVIARGQKFPSGTTDAVMALVDKLPIKLASIVKLSPEKATDFEVDIDISKTGVSKAEEQFVDQLAVQVRDQLRENKIDGVDLIFQRNDQDRRAKKLAVFDMDSTLIQQEVIELIAAQAHCEAEVAAITAAAMNGELDFKHSLARRVALLKGIESENLWNDLKPRLKFTPGAKELCRFLKSKGCKLAVFSGGFLPLANFVKQELGLDYAFANVLATEFNADGKEVLSGETLGEVVDGLKKRELMDQIAAENGISLVRTVATGDGANDLPMMKRAGFGIAWNAKPKVQLEAPSCLNSNSLKDSLYIYGYNDTEIEKALSK
ncbi:DEKNAAC101729 [Brettanomyces naardenensis]|uniref:phosphoserine phosphatase n=1 Tax=Brettanomyces naardenensis TaxID=13370 RepID=A0A448YIX5_BRENA|nr:DEKNAAC101729 [Brettanomyces naardenensis]